MTVTAIQQPPEASPSLSLVEKLAAVMAAVERVPKSGWNDFHKYHYATEADITDAVRANLAKHGVMLIPSVEKLEWSTITTKSGSDRLATMTVRFTATDGKDKIDFVAIGEGQDRGDKATYKAMTGAMKYALLKLFMIPTGDDPETEGEERPHAGVRENPKHPPPPATKAEQVTPAAKALPAPHVAALWARLLAYQGGNKALADTALKKAATEVFGENPPPTKEWTVEHTKAVTLAIWPDDVPF